MSEVPMQTVVLGCIPADTTIVRNCRTVFNNAPIDLGLGLGSRAWEWALRVGKLGPAPRAPSSRLCGFGLMVLGLGSGG